MENEELLKVMNHMNSYQLEGYTSFLPELEKWLKNRGHFKGEMAILGLVLFYKYKDKMIELNKFSDDLQKTVADAQAFLDRVKAGEFDNE
jgi:hypothetical protein